MEILSLREHVHYTALRVFFSLTSKPQYVVFYPYARDWVTCTRYHHYLSDIKMDATALYISVYMCMYPFKQYNFSTTIRVASTSLYKSVKVKRKYIIKNTNCMHKS